MAIILSEKLRKQISEEKKGFIITGANGWLGKVIIDILYNCFGSEIDKYIFPISTSTKEIVLSNDYKIKTYNYDYDFPKLNFIICHFAFLTKDKVSLMDIESYKKANLEIRDKTTKIIDSVKTDSILYTSSGAVYDDKDIYGILKLEDEKYFSNLASKVKAEIIIPRIFNIAGPYINKHSVYAISSFINQAINNKEIIINSNSPVIRSYIHVKDLFEICFSWLLDKNKTEKFIRFDTANQKEMEIFELAELILKNMQKDIPIIRKSYDKKGARNYYVGNIERQNYLCSKYDLSISDYDKIIMDTVRYLLD